MVVGPWTPEAAALVAEGFVDGLVLNYARGFQELDLEFLDAWPLRRLDVLDRKLVDLTPVGKLGATLQSLSVQAAPNTRMDLADLPRLRVLAAWWDVVKDTIHQPEALNTVIVMDYDEVSLRPLSAQPALERLILKFAPSLETLDGAEDLSSLTTIRVAGARELHDLSSLATLDGSMIEVDIQACLDLNALDDLSGLHKLRFLGANDCGRLASLTPIASLEKLVVFHGWGTTRIEDNDLSPLVQLPLLSEIRMRDRRDYNPRVSELQKHLAPPSGEPWSRLG